MKTRLLIAAWISLAFALPAFSETYKSNYAMPCSDVWSAVRETLNNSQNYSIVKSDDNEMSATYKVKHTAHVNISGAVLQRDNKVKLVPKDSGCEMQVVSNYSGWEHNDREDFKKRVDGFLAQAKPAEPKTEEAAPAADRPN